MAAEDFNKLRVIAKKLVETPFRHPWEFRLEVESYPKDDFDLYVREITYGPIEIETEQLRVGGIVLTWPQSVQPVTISMVMRDHIDSRVSDWFGARVAKIFNPDGTVNLPGNYILDIHRYALMHGAKDRLADTWSVIPTQLGDVTESRDGEGLLEFPITFVEFRSM